MNDTKQLLKEIDTHIDYNINATVLDGVYANAGAKDLKKQMRTALDRYAREVIKAIRPEERDFRRNVSVFPHGTIEIAEEFGWNACLVDLDANLEKYLENN